VHSSTSHSDPNDSGWGKAFALGVGLALAFVGALEVACRREPHVSISAPENDIAFWARHRARVGRGDPDQLVLVGTSRMLRAISGEVLRAELGRQDYVQLALLASAPGATLKDLLLDERFRGILISDAWEGSEVWNTTEQESYVRYFHERWNWNERANALLSTFLHEHLLVDTRSKPVWRFYSLIKHFNLRAAPQTGVAADRTYVADAERDTPPFQRDELRDLKGAGEDPPEVVERWMRPSREFEPLIRAFQARGGRMIYLRVATSLVDDPDEALARAARKNFWDPFAAQTHAIPIHFLDVPDMRGLASNDGSHLDLDAARTFTRALVKELRRRALVK